MRRDHSPPRIVYFVKKIFSLKNQNGTNQIRIQILCKTCFNLYNFGITDFIQVTAISVTIQKLVCSVLNISYRRYI